MSVYDIEKTVPVWAVTSAGTGLGTCSAIVDTSAWNTMQVMCIHGGTGGSRDVLVWGNAGTQHGTGVTTFPDAILLGSKNSDQAGAGTPLWQVGSLTQQAIITYGTSSDSSFRISYTMHD